MARYSYLFQEAFVGLRRNLLMTVAVILSVAISLMLLGASLLVRDQVARINGEWTGKIEVSIFLCDENTCGAITEEMRTNLEEALTNDPLVAEVHYESKEQALENFRIIFEDDPDILQTVTADALPASFRVKLKDPELFRAISDKYEAWPGVEEIFDERDVVDQLFALTDVFRIGAAVLAGALFIVAMVLIVNTIRVAAFARREQTSIMRLVGASNWYIRLPFVLEGIIAGVLGAVIAVGILAVAVPLFTDFLGDNIQFISSWIDLEEVVAVAPLLLLAGVLLATMSSFLALRRFLDV